MGAHCRADARCVYALDTGVNDSAIKTGTAGIRIDAAEGSFVDDWRVYAP